jgi:HTH-type transcriptional regulator/antitoxin HigA
MKSTIPDAGYMKLIRAFPLRPLQTAGDYDTAVDVLDRLALQGEENLKKGEQDYLAVLSALVEAYDDEHFVIPDDTRPISLRLASLMADAGMSKADLARELGVSHTLVSLMLSGKRDFSKENVVKLANRFALEPGYFLPLAKTQSRHRQSSRRRAG